MDSDDDGGTAALFCDPPGFYAPETPATCASYRTRSGTQLRLGLVGHHSLWGQFLWNAGRVMAAHLEDNAGQLVKGRTVLELGAASGLPSIVCALNGARRVVATDYPDADLLGNLTANAARYCIDVARPCPIAVAGHVWGGSVQEVTSYVHPDRGFDVLILADLLANYSEHGKLVQSVQRTLNRTSSARALVFFTHHQPWLVAKNMAFFELARSEGFGVSKLFEQVVEKVMFEADVGDELLRRTVYGYELKWSDQDGAKHSA